MRIEEKKADNLTSHKKGCYKWSRHQELMHNFKNRQTRN